MASSVHKTPTEKAAPAKSNTENSTAKAQHSGKGKSMETEQIQQEKAGATQNPTGQRAMNRLANNNGSYPESAGELPVNETGTGGGVGFEGRGGMNARGGAQGQGAGGEQSFQGTYGQPEAGIGALHQNLADSVAKIQADVDTIKAGLGTPPANLTGPGVVGPSVDQIKPQRIA